MRTRQEILDRIAQCDQNIHEHGWHPGIDADVHALQWVLNEPPATRDLIIELLEVPDGQRRLQWIAAGGDRADWPEGAPGGSAQSTTR